MLAIGAQLLQLCWLIMWATALAGSLAHEDGWVALLLLLSNLWTMQVIKNVVHVSAAGTAAAWFFQTGEPNATRASLRRALTSSFGSICLGSLLVALIRTLRLCVPSRPRGAATRNLCCIALACALRLLEGLVVVWNHLGFTFVAIYGYDYQQAGREAYALVREVGLLPLVNMALLQGVCLFGCVVGGCVSALIGAGLLPAFGLAGRIAEWAVVGLCWLLGFSMALPAMEVVESVVTSLFICYAKHAPSLRTHAPELYAEIRAAAELEGMRLAEGAGDDGYDYDGYGSSSSSYEYSGSDDDDGGGGGAEAQGRRQPAVPSVLGP